MLQLIRQGVGSLDEYAIIAPMRVLVVATPAAPAVTRLAPTLATLLAHGAEIYAHEPLSTELAREGIPHTPLNATALDATIRGLTAAFLLRRSARATSANHSPRSPVRSALEQTPRSSWSIQQTRVT